MKIRWGVVVWRLRLTWHSDTGQEIWGLSSQLQSHLVKGRQTLSFCSKNWQTATVNLKETTNTGTHKVWHTRADTHKHEALKMVFLIYWSYELCVNGFSECLFATDLRSCSSMGLFDRGGMFYLWAICRLQYFVCNLLWTRANAAYHSSPCSVSIITVDMIVFEIKVKRLTF